MGHLFADDLQAYLPGPPSTQFSFVGRIRALSHELHLFMASNRISFNHSNSSGPALQLQRLDILILDDNLSTFAFSTSVRDLGVLLNSFPLYLNISVTCHKIPTFNISGASGGGCRPVST